MVVSTRRTERKQGKGGRGGSINRYFPCAFLPLLLHGLHKKHKKKMKKTKAESFQLSCSHPPASLGVVWMERMVSFIGTSFLCMSVGEIWDERYLYSGAIFGPLLKIVDLPTYLRNLQGNGWHLIINVS